MPGNTILGSLHGQGSGGGGPSFALGPAQNTFNAATQAAGIVARDAYASANADWLAAYDDSNVLMVRVTWPAIPTDQVFYSRANDAWVELAGVIEGRRGERGLPGTDGTSGTVIMAGSTVLDEIAWDPDANSGIGAWVPVSSEDDLYFALTRQDTYASIAEAIEYVLDNLGSRYPAFGSQGSTLEAFSVVDNRLGPLNENLNDQQINNVWPDGGPAPFAWILAPNAQDWINNFLFHYSAQPGVTVTRVPDVAQENKIKINGVPYDWARVELDGLSRPLDEGSFRGQLYATYVQPTQASDVEEITP